MRRYQRARILILIVQIFSCTGFYLYGQTSKITALDYEVYSAFIKKEVPGNKKSMVIIDKTVNDTSQYSWAINELRSKDIQQLQQFYFLARDGKGNSVHSMDTSIHNLIIQFGEKHFNITNLTNQFDVLPTVYLTVKSPIKTGSEEEWEPFYEKYPGSAGIFEFSQIYYSPDSSLSVFYHSNMRRGLSGHGSLTIMNQNNGHWELKYEIYLWQA